MGLSWGKETIKYPAGNERAVVVEHWKEIRGGGKGEKDQALQKPRDAEVDWLVLVLSLSHSSAECSWSGKWKESQLPFTSEPLFNNQGCRQKVLGGCCRTE